MPTVRYLPSGGGYETYTEKAALCLYSEKRAYILRKIISDDCNFKFNVI